MLNEDFSYCTRILVKAPKMKIISDNYPNILQDQRQQNQSMIINSHHPFQPKQDANNLELELKKVM